MQIWVLVLFIYSVCICVDVVSLSLLSRSARLRSHTQTSIHPHFLLLFLVVLFLYSFRFPAQMSLPSSLLQPLLALQRVTRVLGKSRLSDEDRWNFFAVHRQAISTCSAALWFHLSDLYVWQGRSIQPHAEGVKNKVVMATILSSRYETVSDTMMLNPLLRLRSNGRKSDFWTNCICLLALKDSIYFLFHISVP